jgi:Glycosyltransferase family 87
LGVAIAWRERDKAFVAGGAIASVVVAKLFPWTTSIWLLVTRRFRALALATVVAVVFILGGWALINLHGMTSYPEMLSNLSLLQRSSGVSVVAAFLSIGVSPAVAQAAGLLAGATLLVISGHLIGRPDGDARALGLAVVAALVASPNVWPHYFVLLFVPIALMSPTFSPLWLVPMLAWLVPVDQGAGLVVVPYLAIEGILIMRLWIGRASTAQVPGEVRRWRVLP